MHLVSLRPFSIYAHIHIKLYAPLIYTVNYIILSIC